MAEQLPDVQPLPRVPTEIAGLDRVLKGGLLLGGLYLIMGGPGTGKTVLANHLSFNHVRAGGRVVYLSVATETYDRMLSQIQGFSFFDPAPISRNLYYIAGYRTLEEGGLPGLMTLIRTIIREHRATLLVIDGQATVELTAESQLALKRFMTELYTFANASRCTVVIQRLLADAESFPDLAVFDGIVELARQQYGLRMERMLRVVKFRGGPYVDGWHFFEITQAGLVLYPRAEAVFVSHAPVPTETRRRLTFNIPGLDEMLGGGVLSGSTTLLLGTAGSGKTALGLSFLAAGAKEEQPGLYVGMYEPPSHVIGAADRIGLDFGQLVRRDQIEIIWQPPTEQLPDRLAEHLLNAVDRRNVKRLVVDGVDWFAESAVLRDRAGRFFAAIASALVARDVTTLFTLDVPFFCGPATELPIGGITAVADNIIYLRYFTQRSQMHREVSILKERGSAFDTTIREFTISERGIAVTSKVKRAEAKLTDNAQSVPSTPSGARSIRQSPPSGTAQ